MTDRHAARPLAVRSHGAGIQVVWHGAEARTGEERGAGAGCAVWESNTGSARIFLSRGPVRPGGARKAHRSAETRVRVSACVGLRSRCRSAPLTCVCPALPCPATSRGSWTGSSATRRRFWRQQASRSKRGRSRCVCGCEDGWCAASVVDVKGGDEWSLQCHECGSWDTTYTQKQTRSADEPMTTYVPHTPRCAAVCGVPCSRQPSCHFQICALLGLQSTFPVLLDVTRGLDVATYKHRRLCKLLRERDVADDCSEDGAALQAEADVGAGDLPRAHVLVQASDCERRACIQARPVAVVRGAGRGVPPCCVDVWMAEVMCGRTFKE